MRVTFSSRLARDTRDHKLVVLEILLGPSCAKKGGKATPLSSAQMTLARGSLTHFQKVKIMQRAKSTMASGWGGAAHCRGLGRSCHHRGPSGTARCGPASSPTLVSQLC